ncbi:MAG: hypothetical protein OEX10_04755 [Candidatus Bathyarchaeota archaeon]|nr:hypothetical protein [Candidatus Bathyarchaeota archaeon]MDH5664543.1 hypothetical protein [Candidatus Bathyarchaeota archaeon]
MPSIRSLSSVFGVQYREDDGKDEKKKGEPAENIDKGHQYRFTLCGTVIGCQAIASKPPYLHIYGISS